MHKSLINPNGNWIAAANHLIGDEKALAHAIIISVRGSAPRELGANMLISENQISATYEKNSLNFGDIINYFNQNNLKIEDISTDDGDLEDVFVQLTKH